MQSTNFPAGAIRKPLRNKHDGPMSFNAVEDRAMIMKLIKMFLREIDNFSAQKH